jgi:hypothetical protein
MFDYGTTSLRHEMWVFWIIAQMCDYQLLTTVSNTKQSPSPIRSNLWKVFSGELFLEEDSKLKLLTLCNKSFNMLGKK